MLAEEGMVILKFFLHVSKDEQKKRLESRLNDPHKQWKFDVGDIEERRHWDEYMEAYQDALRKCSQEYAPWYVVPSDRKWFRNWVISDVLVKTLDRLEMNYRKPKDDLSSVVIE